MSPEEITEVSQMVWYLELYSRLYADKLCGHADRKCCAQCRVVLEVFAF